MKEITRPATPGMALSDVDTPALLVDLDTLDQNLRHMANVAEYLEVNLRPHAKTHKCVEIARQQLELGAVGITCQKTAEAEVFVNEGIDDVLITNEVVGDSKVRRVAELAQRSTVAVCVDAPANIEELGAAAVEAGSTIGVMVELNTAEYRAGVKAGEPIVRLAMMAEETAGLSFRGIQAYNGPAQHKRGYEDRSASVDRVVNDVRSSIDLLDHHGITCPTVTGGGTGTYDLEPASGVYTEIQPGSYVFMDGDYMANRDAAGEPFRDFMQSLHLLSGIMSRRPGIAIVDAGSKAIAMGNGLPLLANGGKASYEGFGDEHGFIRNAGETFPSLGESILLVPYNCDPTINLHNWLVGVRNGIVEVVWPIAARGAIS